MHLIQVYEIASNDDHKCVVWRVEFGDSLRFHVCGVRLVASITAVCALCQKGGGVEDK